MRLRHLLTLSCLAGTNLLAQGAKTPPAPPVQAPPATATKPNPPAANLEPGAGSYLSSRLNGKPLPVSDLATDDKGVQFLIEFDELILAIRPNHEFRASLRYRQTLAAKGDKIGKDPIQKMTVYGTYVATGNALRFIPDAKRGGQGLRILDGTFAGKTIEVPFDYRNGSVQRRAQVTLVLNPNIF